MNAHVTAADLGEPLGERATLLQVSTAFCAPCRATRRVLGRVADAVPGVRHVEVDVADAPGLAAALEVTATPTVVVLDATGAVTVRAEGVPTTRQVVAALASVVPDGATSDTATSDTATSDTATSDTATSGGANAPTHPRPRA